MKNNILKNVIIIMFIFPFFLFGQTKQNLSKSKKYTNVIVKGLPNDALNDLLNTCAISCENGNDNLNAFALYKLNLKWGQTNKDAAQAFRNSRNNEQLRDRIFLFFYGEEEFMKINFLTLGVRAKNCEILSKFLVDNIEAIKARNLKAENE
ncbi:hypothetical protein ACFX5E_05290 [Flavobacterium sp. LS2P90]|uniref:Uncharacterized protein n=1 Tax=Flavobacterium xylosi TaxID=3230415 RepID=A0ABW6HU19_9FLAO